MLISMLFVVNMNQREKVLGLGPVPRLTTRRYLTNGGSHAPEDAEPPNERPGFAMLQA